MEVILALFGNEAYLALFGAIFGGVGLKFVEHWLGKKKYEEDVGTQFRKELREEIKTMRAELKQAEDDSDKYRDMYWQQVELVAELRAAKQLSDHKVNEVTKVVDDKHPNEGLGEVMNLPS